MDYRKTIGSIALVFTAAACLAAPVREHDNNIQYKDGEALKITSKIGVEVRVTPGAPVKVIQGLTGDSAEIIGIENSTEPTLAKIKFGEANASNIVESMIGARIAENNTTVVNPADANLQAQIDALREQLANIPDVTALALDYASFKSITKSRNAYFYNEIAHTGLCATNTDENLDKINFGTTVGFRSVTFRPDVDEGFVGDTRGNTWHWVGSANSTKTDFLTGSNWTRINSEHSIVPRDSANTDGYGVCSNTYFRSIAYNRVEEAWYACRQGYGIWKYNDSTWSREETPSVPGTSDGPNAYHIAVGADGTMVATTELGPMYKKLNGKWTLIGGVFNDYRAANPGNCAIRGVVAGNEFIQWNTTPRTTEVKQTRDLGLRDADNPDYIFPVVSRFVVAATTGAGGVWYSDPYDITNWIPAKLDGGSFNINVRQVAFHNGTYVMGAFCPDNSTAIESGIYYSLDGINWKLCPDTKSSKYVHTTDGKSRWYEPIFSMGMFIMPSPYEGTSNTPFYCTDPATQPWLPLGAPFIGWNADNTVYGAAIAGPYGCGLVNGGVTLRSNVIYSKAEIDAMIKASVDAAIESLRSRDSLQ